MGHYDLSKQEIFEKVAKHLFKQARQANVEDGMGCAYRSKDGAMCAVGCLIADEDYSPDLEGFGIYSLRGQQSLLTPPLKAFLNANVDLLHDLQGIHDNMNVDYKTPEEYVRERLKWVAKDFGLDARFIDNLKWGE